MSAAGGIAGGECGHREFRYEIKYGAHLFVCQGCGRALALPDPGPYSNEELRGKFVAYFGNGSSTVPVSDTADAAERGCAKAPAGTRFVAGSDKIGKILGMTSWHGHLIVCAEAGVFLAVNHPRGPYLEPITTAPPPVNG